MHRDLKPQNILLTKRDKLDSLLPVLKLADFGFARYLGSSGTSMANTFCGSPLYMVCATENSGV